MSGIIESTTLVFHILLTVVGVFVVILLSRVYSLYRKMKINRSVMTLMLIAGLFTALTGVTELILPALGEFGHFTHTIAMLLTAVFFAYGVYSYHQMLKRITEIR